MPKKLKSNPDHGSGFLCPFCDTEKAYYNTCQIIRCDKCENRIYTQPPTPKTLILRHPGIELSSLQTGLNLSVGYRGFTQYAQT